MKKYWVFQAILLACVATAISIIVVSRLTWSSNPNFFFQESHGIAYNHPLTLGTLCDANPLAGLEGPLANVTDHRSSSLIYAVPSKLLAESVNLYTVHRIINGTLYALLLALLASLGLAMKFSLPMTLFLLIYYGLSEQALSLLFEAKLTLSSAVWLAWTILLFVLLNNSLLRQKKSFYLYLFLVPITAALSYETYCVSRPLAVTYWLFIPLWLACHRHQWPLIGLQLVIFILSSTFSYFLLKLLHPGIRFDLSLFEGRTESIVRGDGEVRSEWLETIWARIQELPYLFRWPNHSLFVSEGPYEAGWLEIWIALFVLSLLVLVISLSRKHRANIKEALHCNASVIGLTLILSLVALVVPLASTTFIRGHRFFGLYLTSTFLTVILGDILIKKGGFWIKWILIYCSLAATAATLIHRVPLVAHWSPPQHYTLEHFHDLLSQLSKLEPPEDFNPAPEGVEVRVCDLKNRPDWEHSWNAALYVSRFGCKIRGERLHGHIMDGNSCDCNLGKNKDDLVRVLCIQRQVENNRNVITLQY
jgi:hypothetical protein